MKWACLLLVQWNPGTDITFSWFTEFRSTDTCLPFLPSPEQVLKITVTCCQNTQNFCLIQDGGVCFFDEGEYEALDTGGEISFGPLTNISIDDCCEVTLN